MANPQHLEWLREGVDAWNDRRKRDDFRPNLREADLVGAVLWRADLVGADLRDADLGGADLRGADLGGADLVGAVLWRADLVGADLGGADLGGADLVGADLVGAVLRDADLRGADLRGANVKSVKSQVSTNDGGTWLFTDLSEARSLTQSQLDDMLGDSGTIIPSDLTRPAHWPELEEVAASPRPAVAPPPDDTPKPMASVLTSDGERVLACALSLIQATATVRDLLERQHNQMTQEGRDEVSALLHQVDRRTAALADAVATTGTPDQSVVAQAEEDRRGFVASFRKACDALLAEERLGKQAAVSAFIFAGAAFGSAIGLALGSVLTGPVYPLVIAGGAVGVKIGSILADQEKLGPTAGKEMDEARKASTSEDD